MTYTLIANSSTVIRDADQAHIPPDPGNRDWQEHQAWLAEGNTPNPAPPRSPAVPLPACSVYQNATQAISKNTPTKILFDTVEFDVTSAFDIANARFQPDVDGYYEMNCGCGVAAGSVKIYASIYKNGAEYRRSTTTSEANARLSTLVHLDGTTDYIEGYVYCTANFSTVTGGVMTSFSAFLAQPEL